MRFNRKHIVTFILVLNFLSFSWFPYVGLLRVIVILSGFFLISSSKLLNREQLTLIIVVCILSFLLLISPTSSFASILYVLHMFVLLTILIVIKETYTTNEKFDALRAAMRILMILSFVAFVFFPSYAFDNIYGNDDLSYGFQLTGIFSTANYFFMALVIYVFSLIVTYRKNKDIMNIIDIFILISILAYIISYPLVNRTALISFAVLLLLFFPRMFVLSSILAVASLMTTQFELSDIIKIKDIVELGILGNRGLLWATSLNSLNNDMILVFGYGVGNEVDYLNPIVGSSGFLNLHAHSTIFSSIIELGLFKSLMFLTLLAILSFVSISRRANGGKALKLLLIILMPFVIFDTTLLKSTNILFLPVFFFILSRRTV